MTAFGAVVRVEIKLFLREPLTILFVLVLPLVVLYVLNGVFGGQPQGADVWEGVGAVDFYTPAYVTLVVATAGVLSLPVHLAGYREKGVLRRFRASRLSPAVLVAAHMAVTAMVATAGALLLAVLSVTGYDASPPQDVLGTLAAYALVVTAFTALGSLLGFLLPTARAAQGVGVLLFFVFMLLGGGGPPREVLPDAMAGIGDVLPVTHAGRLLRGPWLGDGWDAGALAVVLVLLLGCLALLAWRFRTAEPQ